MTTINYTNGVLIVQIDYARREDIKELPAKRRAWDGDSKTWTVDRNLLGELLALFPDATMTADVQKLSEILILEQCQRWRDSGVTLIRDGDKLTALHNAAPSADIAALQKHVDAIAPDILRLLDAGQTVAGVRKAVHPTPEDAGMFQFMQTIQRKWPDWERQAQNKKRMMMKGRYRRQKSP